MTYVLAVVFLPPLLIFGLYHLSLWFNFLGIGQMAFWRRVALTSAISHGLLVTGFFVFSYLDYQASRDLILLGKTFDSYLFNRSQFWQLLAIFDTFPTVTLLGLFALLDRFGLGSPQLVAVTIAIVYLTGTFQWYWVGGGIGAVFEKLWSGLKGPDDTGGWL